jgi:hypothetical protein
MKVRFNFNLSTWMRYVEVEGDSYDDALENLYKMSLADLLEAGMDDETSISDVEGEIIERTIKVKAYDIEYDIEEDDYEDLDEYNEIINSLPTEMTLEVTLEDDQDEEEVIADEITYKTDWLVKNFNYMIIEEK